MTSTCALLKRSTRTINRLVLLCDLKFKQIDRSAFEAELSVLDKFMDKILILFMNSQNFSCLTEKYFWYFQQF